MIRSMTGFGAAEITVGVMRHRIEIKAVNGKFCDVKIKLPQDYSSLEVNVQQTIRSAINRGHIEIYVSRDIGSGDGPTGVVVNWALAESYYKAYQSIRHKFGIGQDVSLAMVTNAREVITFQQRDENIDAVWIKLEEGIKAAVAAVVRMREAEGKTLAVDMAGRCNAIREMVGQVNKLAPTILEQYKKRLEEKIAAVNPAEIDESRLAQEIVYFSDRSDITEEVTRLRSHLQQFLHFLNAEEPVGRKLDFIVQEMNREANTIGSKCSSAEVAQLVVEIKTELEKLREQIQNIE
ncbi:MAG: YicC family protein [Myxococcales bacterium]|nr:MAG: YicC family protein [Myxococcales bacterium]